MAFTYENKGTPIISGFDLRAKAPLDSRTVVNDLEALNGISSKIIYEGLKVYVKSEKADYQYVQDGLDANEQPKFIWRKCISADDTFEVINNLTSTSTTDALSAYQGKVLDEKIDLSVNNLTQNLNDEVDALETSITNLSNSTNQSFSQVNSALNTIDGDEQTEGSFRKAIKDATDEIDEEISNINDNLTTLNTASTDYNSRLNTLEGDNTTEGSVAKAVKDASDALTADYTSAIETLSNTVSANKTAIEGSLSDEISARETAISGLQDQINNLSGNTDDEITAIKGRLDTDESNIATNAADIDTLENGLNDTIQAVNQNTSAISTLNGADNVVGSVDYKIKEAVDEITDTIGTKKLISEAVTVSQNGQTSFTFGINKIPNGYNITEDAILLIINGITYAESQIFSVNRTNHGFTWVNTDFSLETEDSVTIVYTIMSGEGGNTPSPSPEPTKDDIINQYLNDNWQSDSIDYTE